MAGITETDLTCPVCCDIFRDPVILICSHTVCKACVEEYWRHKGSRECPVCRKRLKKLNPPCNLAVKNICEAFVQERTQRAETDAESVVFCGLHRTEKLTLFCLEDMQLICVVCQTSSEHQDHRCCPTDQAALDCKETVKTALVPLKKQQKAFNGVKRAYEEMAVYLETQAKQTREQIEEQFEKLHRFLRDEERVRLVALKGEEESKGWLLNKKINSTAKYIACLSDTVRAIEEELEAENIHFLHTYKATVKQTVCSLPDPKLEFGMLIDVAKHLGNLSFYVWKKMKEMAEYTPVIVDPNTASPLLTISGDLTAINYRHWEDNGESIVKFPANPERLNEDGFVLGSVGFTSGIHCWEVEVKGCMDWDVGVISESSLKNMNDCFKEMWGIEHVCGFTDCSPAQYGVSLNVSHELERIRVQLDCERGSVSFSDPVNIQHIHTFTTVRGKVFPYFYNLHDENGDNPVKLLPENVCVVVEPFVF